ncbi:MAG: translation initiation factor 2 [Alphaproteobacteria bacterium]
MKSTLIKTCVVLGALSLTACSSIITGTTQNIAVQTEPSGAACQVQRDNQVIGYVDPTPGAIKVKKSSNDITVVCMKQGYHNQGELTAASFQAMTLANVVLGGVVGIIVDAATGAISKYPDSVFVRLLPVQDQPQQHSQNTTMQ